MFAQQQGPVTRLPVKTARSVSELPDGRTFGFITENEENIVAKFLKVLYKKCTIKIFLTCN
jgi:hypothetical protein